MQEPVYDADGKVRPITTDGAVAAVAVGAGQVGEPDGATFGLPRWRS
jgi:hypothetical protein